MTAVLMLLAEGTKQLRHALCHSQDLACPSMK